MLEVANSFKEEIAKVDETVKVKEIEGSPTNQVIRTPVSYINRIVPGPEVWPWTAINQVILGQPVRRSVPHRTPRQINQFILRHRHHGGFKRIVGTLIEIEGSPANRINCQAGSSSSCPWPRTLFKLFLALKSGPG